MLYFLLDWQNLVAIAIVLAGVAWMITALRGYLRIRNDERKMRAREARLIPVQAGPLKGHTDTKIVHIDEKDSEVFFSSRLQEKAYLERQHKLEQQRQTQREQQIAQSLNHWAQSEQEKQEEFEALDLAANETGKQQIIGKQSKTDHTLMQWAVDNSDELADVARRGTLVDQNLQKIQNQIVAATTEIEKEANDLSHMVDKLQTSIDFIELEFQDVVNQWKQGKIYRSDTLADLKQRYRLKTLSIEDSWQLVFSYPDWIIKQRKQLVDFVAQLGTERQKSESVSALLERAETEQWRDNLNVNMDIVFMLQEIGKMQRTLAVMEERVMALENACRKRSEQIIMPSWEPAKLQR